MLFKNRLIAVHRSDFSILDNFLHNLFDMGVEEPLQLQLGGQLLVLGLIFPGGLHYLFVDLVVGVQDGDLLQNLLQGERASVFLEEFYELESVLLEAELDLLNFLLGYRLDAGLVPSPVA